MDEKELHESWPELKEKLMQKYPHLTQDELVLEIGKEKDLLESLQTKLGKNWKDIRNLLSFMG